MREADGRLASVGRVGGDAGTVTPDAGASVPHGIRVGAAWSWRLLVIGTATYFILYLVGYLSAVVIPLVIAVLLTALLSPAVAALRRYLPGSLATAIVVICGIAAVVGVLTAVVEQLIAGFPKLSGNAAAGVQRVQSWLHGAPLHLTDQQLSRFFDSVGTWLTNNQGKLTSAGLATLSTTAHVLTGALLVLFATFFLLRDGRRIWNFVVMLLPGAVREPVAGAGAASWPTLTSYVRTTVLVAFIDAVGIGLGILLLGVPLALPLAALVFLAAFVPIVGATASGAVAVLVALVAKGPVSALLVLAVVIAVQQLEGHVLQPLLMGRAVAIHPLAVIVSIGIGLVVAGIIGALVAVPCAAVLNTAVRYRAGRRQGTGATAVAAPD